MTSCSAGYRYDVDIGIEFDTIPTNERTNRYTLEYAISIFDGWKLSFKICTKNTGTPGDGGQDTFDTIDRIFDISIFQDIETSDTTSNTMDILIVWTKDGIRTQQLQQLQK